MANTRVQFHSGGTLRKRVDIATIGGPASDADIRNILPARLHKAFDRATWTPYLSDVMRRDMTSLAGKPLGTVFAYFTI